MHKLPITQCWVIRVIQDHLTSEREKRPASGKLGLDEDLLIEVADTKSFTDRPAVIPFLKKLRFSDNCPRLRNGPVSGLQMSHNPFHIHNPVKVMHFYAMGMVLTGMVAHNGHSQPITHTFPALEPLWAPPAVHIHG